MWGESEEFQYSVCADLGLGEAHIRAHLANHRSAPWTSVCEICNTVELLSISEEMFLLLIVKAIHAPSKNFGKYVKGNKSGRKFAYNPLTPKHASDFDTFFLIFNEFFP